MSPKQGDVVLTRDALLGGRLVLWQPGRGVGYRFNLDPVLLAGFVTPARSVLDLGAGVGVVALLLLAKGKAEHATAVEVQPELAALARRNAAANGFSERLAVCDGDLRAYHGAPVELALFNPPYFASDSDGARRGRGAASRSRDRARHERDGTLADFVRVAVAHLEPQGRLAAILPVGRAEELVALCRKAGLGRIRSREVRPRDETPAKLILLEASRAARPSRRREHALVLHRGRGRDFTPEVEAYLAP